VANTINSELNKKLNAIKLIVLDVDGVLTDGAIIYAGGDTDIKAFHVQDGFGITLARQAGLKFAVLTGRTSDAVKRRVTELGFDYYECGHFYKQDALQEIINKAGLKKENVLYMGDDILDLVCAPYVGIFVAPDNALPRVKKEADWVTKRKGGDTAVREMIDALLDAQEKLTITEDYFIGAKK
jgi:3-deoxy-D-manno-octulosonate 8-phosphate phosphatase (KDO 8-P phosphatase)